MSLSRLGERYIRLTPGARGYPGLPGSGPGRRGWLRTRTFGRKSPLRHFDWVLIAAVLALTLAACSSSSKATHAGGAGTTTSSTSASHVVSQVLGTGVTATTIKVGISLVDFSCVQQYVQSIRLHGIDAGRQYVEDHVDARPDFAGFLAQAGEQRLADRAEGARRLMPR